MAIVINHAPKWAQAAIGAGQGLVQGLHAKDQHDRYKAEIAKAALDLQGEKDRQALVKARADAQALTDQRNATEQNQNIEAGRAKLDAFKEDRAAAKGDRAAMAGVSPFDTVLQDPNLPDQVRQQLTRDKAIHGKLSTPETKTQFVKDSLTAARSALVEHQREQVKKGIEDRLSVGAYGEDQAVHDGAASLGQLLDAGEDPSKVAEMDLKLRQDSANAMKAKMRRERVTNDIVSRMQTLPLDSPAQDAMESVLADYQAGIIPDEKVHEALSAAQNAGQPKDPMAVRRQAHAMALDEVAALASAGVPATLALVDQLYKKHLLELQPAEGPSARSLDPMQPIRGAPGTDQPQQLPQGSPAAPATPEQTMQSVEQAKTLTAPKTPQEATQRFDEAVKAGASDDELRALLRAAGLDPNGSPAQLEAKKPKAKRRTAERVGPNT